MKLGSKCAPGVHLSSAWVPQPTERHASLLGEFLALPGVHGNLVPDAHLPALAWSTGKRSAPRMGTLPDFWDCDGLIRSHHETNYQIDWHLRNILRCDPG